jgi:hypothetical protein
MEREFECKRSSPLRTLSSGGRVIVRTRCAFARPVRTRTSTLRADCFGTWCCNVVADRVGQSVVPGRNKCECAATTRSRGAALRNQRRSPRLWIGGSPQLGGARSSGARESGCNPSLRLLAHAVRHRFRGAVSTQRLLSPLRCSRRKPRVGSGISRDACANDCRVARISGTPCEFAFAGLGRFRGCAAARSDVRPRRRLTLGSGLRPPLLAAGAGQARLGPAG